MLIVLLASVFLNTELLELPAAIQDIRDKVQDRLELYEQEEKDDVALRAYTLDALFPSDIATRIAVKKWKERKIED